MLYILIGFAPGLYWLWYFYKRDKLEPEPKIMIIYAYLTGILATFVVIGTQRLFKLDMFTRVVIAAPILEEFAKFLMVWVFFYRNKNFNEPMDGIVYSAAVALGFASLENAMYLVRAYSQGPSMLSNTLLIRAFLSVPGHALFASFWGYALARYKFSSNKKIMVVFGGLLMSMIMHGLFNFLCIVQVFSSFGLLVLVAVMWGIMNKRITKAESDSPYAPISFLGWKKKRKVRDKK
jgi:protease PrsW